MTLEASYILRDDDGNEIQNGMMTFDNSELTAGEVGATIKIKYDKDVMQVDHVGVTPRDRK